MNVDDDENESKERTNFLCELGARIRTDTRQLRGHVDGCKLNLFSRTFTGTAPSGLRLRVAQPEAVLRFDNHRVYS